MKKYVSVLILLILTLTYGACGNKEIKGEVKIFIKNQENFTKEKDIEKYMDTISKEQEEYVAEKKSWIRDIKNNNIEDYTLTIEKLKILDVSKVYVKIKQSYRYKEEKYNIVYPLLLVKEKGRWKDGDLNFEEMNTTHFKIKYLKKSKKYAKRIEKVCETAYNNITNRYGESINDCTVIKLYEDEERLRQSVKLSFAWKFAGWYEYPESIKTTKYEEEETYRKILEHELMHKFTISKSNNNMPYWFTEGLAVYFANFQNESKEYSKKSTYLRTYKGLIMNIQEIEKANLEKMKDPKKIANYYDNAGMIVKFMVEQYGIQKVKEIVEILGEFSYKEGTGAEVDEQAIKRFHWILPKVIGINIEALNKEWEKYLYETE
ncbi:gluzincin family metallopeptidase [Marinisporobacter balticus]|uniref:Peptidase MA superfamily protein n=1 Tax=Marinisporobacter balticus TaxID=2018667 RepID=A0A4R2L6Z4_9FIRM|nr:hypothetical protein [Marinisporobacter balticus]TCO74975.1 hypothetical protein EV214_11046 [Marinisporobacter balticus]